ncbi:RHS repeat-associated core domain-containing protein [Micromonospora sp. NPDC049004]|uniref:RHS repeat-associated core domain-containing protein n=1 Tax=Micromonospora sp. NPDC049004 TaxID=3154348 RepID=UPI0033D03D72
MLPTSRSGSHRAAAALLSGALVVSVLVAPPDAVAKPKPHLSAQQEALDSDGGPATGRAWPAKAARNAQLAAPVWPKPGRATVTLPEAGVGQRQSAAPAVRAGALPVTVRRAGGPRGERTGAVAVELLDRSAVPQQWRDGLLMRVSGTAAKTEGDAAAGSGAAAVSVDYREFRNAIGGSWSSRLRLWQVPECALQDRPAPGCVATPMPSVNKDGQVSAEVPVPVAAPGARSAGSTLVALAAGAAGSEGDYTATSLTPSATWSAGGATGDFNWSYPMKMPPAIAGPVPTFSLSYSSAAMDGKSGVDNNQPTWVGEGFDLWGGYIERKYVGCGEDMTNSNSSKKTGDQCWRSDNATLSLNGRGSELVYEAGKGWRTRSEDGSKIEKVTGGSNGDDNGEYWKVTTPDGVQYFFGLHGLPGQSAKTNSTWTVPVAGNQSGEPCHSSSFTGSFCNQAWRWNLDYVVDPRGNTMSYWYGTETNYYGRNATNTDKASYIRAGTLTRIDYGTWDRGSADRSVTPTAQVLFTTADRCDADCGTHDAAHWKDVPWDQECTAAAANCKENYSPTYWSTKRLSKITTQVWDTTKTTPAWQGVDSWTLTHTYPAVGDGSDHAGMWLSAIAHTGLAGTAVSMPPVTFEPVALRNRVLTSNNTTNNRMRIGNIVTETGAKIQVTYSLPDCSSGNLPATTYDNTKRCYPVIGADPYDPDGPDITEWWHKYVVTQISESDLMVMVNGTDHGQPVKNTFYTYVGTPAWHYADDDGLVKPKRKTWSQFRGYATVETRTGDAPNQTLTRTTYLRGMHGDRATISGGSRTVPVGASLGSETVYDEDQFAGLVREQVTYNGVSTKPVSKTVNVPWMSPALASRTINGDTVTARFTRTMTTYSATALGVDGAKGWRTTRSESRFDDTYGTTTWTQEDGDTAKTGDEKCTTYSYNRNTAANLVETVKQTTVTALACGVAPAGPDDVISDERSYYDGATSVGTAPTKGLVTKVESLKDWSSASGTVWRVSSESAHDAFGRLTRSTDDRGNVTTKAYLPASGGPLRKLTTTTADPNGGSGWVSTIESEPYRGSPVRTTDPNGRVTDIEYDALGRTAQVWKIGWAKADHPNSPSARYDYTFAAARNAYPYTTSRTLHAGGGYTTSYQIFDALLRARQVQTAAVGGGRVVTDTLYDKAGRAVTTYSAHAEPGTPSGALWWEPEWSVPALTKTVFDGASRATDQIFFGTDGVTNLVEKWRTTTEHLGDATTVTPPSGGVPTTTVVDALGRTVELRQLGSSTVTTRYAYDRKGELRTVTDSLGNEWRYTVDIRGRKTATTDPDKGTSLSEYNDYGDLVKSTDARGEVLVYEYDKLGRKIGMYDDLISAGTKRAEWKYDRLYTGQTLRGQLGQSIRYEPAGSANAYTYRVNGYNDRYQPTGAQYVVPGVEGTGIAGTYNYGFGYSPYTGDATSVTLPGANGLTTETVTTRYDATTGLPSGLDTNLINVGAYVIGQQYTAYGEPTVTTRKINGGVYVEDAAYYDLTTRRLERYKVQPETAAGTVQDTSYGYDAAGNILAVADAPQVGSADSQCFGYDSLRRLTSAWSPKAGVACATAPSTANLGGPAPYWHEWKIDDIGNRRTETVHTAGGDTVRTYGVPASGKDQVRPHGLDSVSTAINAGAAVTTRYGYDSTGNMTCRPTGTTANTCDAAYTNSQALSWNSEGKLASVSTAGQSVESNVYDVDGNRLVRRDATGTTLYLPGQEIRRASNSTTSAVRYYTFSGRTVASRDANGLTWLYSDHQGTQQVSVDVLSQQVSVRRQTPYGDPRGSQPQWRNSKGFVGGDKDPTGMTHIGARDYDPGLGRFVSVDPVQDLKDPQQFHAYAYANNSPVTASDPTGTIPEGVSMQEYQQDILHDVENRKRLARDPVLNGWGGRRPPRLTKTKDWEKQYRKVVGATMWRNPSGPAAWLLMAVESAQEADIDPRWLLAVLMAEVGNSEKYASIDQNVQAASVVADKLGIYGPLKEFVGNVTGFKKGEQANPPSIGWGNIQQEAFEQTKTNHPEALGDLDWSSLIWHNDLSIKVTAYRLKDTTAMAERTATAGMKEKWTPQQVGAGIYNVGERNYNDAVGQGGDLGPRATVYATSIGRYYQTADRLVCYSGVFTCS